MQWPAEPRGGRLHWMPDWRDGSRVTSAEDLHIEVSTSGGADGSGIGSIGYQGERELVLTAAGGTLCHAKVTRTQLTRLRRDAKSQFAFKPFRIFVGTPTYLDVILPVLL